MIYIRDLGVRWLCAAAGRAVDISVARGKWVSFFLSLFLSFFPVSVCGLALEEFGKNLGSVVIGVLTGPWAAERAGVCQCVPPPKFTFFISVLVDFKILFSFVLTYLLYLLTNNRGPPDVHYVVEGPLYKH